jgi:hypothetical protein
VTSTGLLSVLNLFRIREYLFFLSETDVYSLKQMKTGLITSGMVTGICFGMNYARK